jgi:hypothetical protein
MKTPEDICPDFPEWPKRWMGSRRDVPYGEAITAAMRPFVEHLIASGLSTRLIRRHLDNLWLLGGEIIRDVNTGGEHKRILPAHKLRQCVGVDGGPYCRHLSSDAEVRSFDATCRRLHAFLEAQNRERADKPPAATPRAAPKPARHP